MKNSEHEIDIQIIKSEKTNIGGVEVGVQVTHKETGLTASSTSYTSQYQNKLAALALLRGRLAATSARFPDSAANIR